MFIFDTEKTHTTHPESSHNSDNVNNSENTEQKIESITMQSYHKIMAESLNEHPIIWDLHRMKDGISNRSDSMKFYKWIVNDTQYLKYKI